MFPLVEMGLSILECNLRIIRMIVEREFNCRSRTGEFSILSKGWRSRTVVFRISSVCNVMISSSVHLECLTEFQFKTFPIRPQKNW